MLNAAPRQILTVCESFEIPVLLDERSAAFVLVLYDEYKPAEPHGENFDDPFRWL